MTETLQKNTYGTLPDKLVRNMLLMHMWSETGGSSTTNLQDQERFLQKYRIFHFPKAALMLLPSPPPLYKKEQKLLSRYQQADYKGLLKIHIYFNVWNPNTKLQCKTAGKTENSCFSYIYTYANNINVSEKKGSRSQERTKRGITGGGTSLFSCPNTHVFTTYYETYWISS